MVRPGRERLSGSVEADETYLGGLEEGVRGRQTESKVLIVVAAEEDGKGIGRIRMRRIPDASARSLVCFVEESVEPGSVVHTDGWLGYEPLQARGYMHQVTFLRGQQKSPSELLPRVHRVISLLKRWLLGTHQGAIGHHHLDDYLDEFTFRFNRRTSASRGKLFYRLAQQAVQVDPAPFAILVKPQPIAFGGVKGDHAITHFAPGRIAANYSAILAANVSTTAMFCGSAGGRLCRGCKYAGLR
jgi:transposase-like protein